MTLRRAEAMLNRLGAEFGAALSHLGAEGQGPRALSRTLGSDVVLCHRLLAGIRSTGAAAERIAKWPGEQGLKMLLQRIRAVSKDRNHADSIALALEEFSRMVALAGGSRSRLVRRMKSLQSSETAGLNVNEASARASCRTLNRAAGEVLGYDVELVTHITAVRPIPGQPELIEGCSAFGLIGIETQGRGICVASKNVQMRGVAGSVAPEVRWKPLGHPVSERDGLLVEFCSSPSILVACDDGDGHMRQMVDLDFLCEHGNADVVLARQWSPDVNPQFTRTPRWSHVLRMRHPARKVLFDGYVHRSMLDGSPPEVGAYVWHPTLPDDPRGQWHDRFPVGCPIRVLSATSALSGSWERQAALTDHLFELAGWNRSEFVGFRCEEHAPVWSAAYYMTFDLRQRQVASSSP